MSINAYFSSFSVDGSTGRKKATPKTHRISADGDLCDFLNSQKIAQKTSKFHCLSHFVASFQNTQITRPVDRFGHLVFRTGCFSSTSDDSSFPAHVSQTVLLQTKGGTTLGLLRPRTTLYTPTIHAHLPTAADLKPLPVFRLTHS